MFIQFGSANSKRSHLSSALTSTCPPPPANLPVRSVCPPSCPLAAADGAEWRALALVPPSLPPTPAHLPSQPSLTSPSAVHPPLPSCPFAVVGGEWRVVVRRGLACYVTAWCGRSVSRRAESSRLAGVQVEPTVSQAIPARPAEPSRFSCSLDGEEKGYPRLYAASRESPEPRRAPTCSPVPRNPRASEAWRGEARMCVCARGSVECGRGPWRSGSPYRCRHVQCVQ